MDLLNASELDWPEASDLPIPSAEDPNLFIDAVNPLTPVAASAMAILVSADTYPSRFISSAAFALSSAISCGVYSVAITIFT